MFGLPNCQETSRLVSESLERKLPWRKRLGLWLHLTMCRLCSGFRKDLFSLHDATRDAAQHGADDKLAGPRSLSPQARERIKQAIEAQDADQP